MCILHNFHVQDVRTLHGFPGRRFGVLTRNPLCDKGILLIVVFGTAVAMFYSTNHPVCARAQA